MRHSLVAGYAKAPSRSRSIPALGTPWARLAAVLLVGLLAHVVLPAEVAPAILNPMGACVGIATVAGLRRSSFRLAWNLVAVGVAAYAAADMIGYVTAGAGIESVTPLLFVGSYAAFAAGFAAFATRR